MTLAEELKSQMGKPPAGRRWNPRPELLLHPQIPKPLHGVAPRTVMPQTWWEKTRRNAIAATIWHCAACGAGWRETEGSRWLECHECYEIDWRRGRMVYVGTVALCHFCHSFIHRGRMEMLVAEDKMAKEEFKKIMNHGLGVLKAAGLKTLPIWTGKIPKWSNWRLVVDGKEFGPKFKTEAAWRKHWSKK